MSGEQRARYLTEVAAGRALVARGVSFSAELMAELTSALRIQLSDGLVLGDRVVFVGSADFTQAKFAPGIQFANATFEGDACFDGATFLGDAVFTNARFETISFQRVVVLGGLDLNQAWFTSTATLSVASRYVSMKRTRFDGVTTFGIRWADVAMEEAEFSKRAILTGVERFDRADGFADEREVALATGEVQGWRPRLLTMRNASVGGLLIAEFDLSACWFAGTLGMETLALLSTVKLASSPEPRWRVLRRWTKRQTIAEEHRWRTRAWHRSDEESAGVGGDRQRPGNWSAVPDIPAWLTVRGAQAQAEERAPLQIANNYRALRKGLEDFGNYPDASDFYYGEMEMRRHGAPTRGEALVLFGYWIASGYGLRASRALICLVAAILLASVALTLWGFPAAVPYGRAMLFATDSSVSLLRAPTARVTDAGEITVIVLRLVGPLLFGLALLALRGRVRR